MKITIIGAGNIGGATALGLAGGGAIAPADITVTARHESTLSKFAAAGLRTSTSNTSAVEGADVVFFAVKPWLMEEVVREVAPALASADALAVSIAPGIKAAQLQDWLSVPGCTTPQIAYAIPNTAIRIGESMTYLSSVSASDERMQALQELFESAGKCAVVPLEEMLSGTSLASCGIAYAMKYIEAASEGGKMLGLEDTLDAVCQTVRGAAALVEGSDSPVQTEIDKVTTPGGLTLKGLKAMEDGGFSESVRKGLLMVKKSKPERVVVKVGSNVLTRADGSLDTTRMSSIVDQIVELRSSGFDVVLVTSGAVACGRSLIREDSTLDPVQQRQLYSAVGQVRLMDHYYKLFFEYGINVGQILTMKNNFLSEVEYNNQKGCMEVMLERGVLPIVNENDTVSITELMFTDNDELSGLVAEMLGAKALVLLTSVDGIYDGAPDAPDSKLIRVVRTSDSLEDCIVEKKSSAGRGGMKSKSSVAALAASKGIRVLIANGRRDNILPDLLKGADVPHTEFIQ